MVLEYQLEMTIKAVFAALKDEHLPDIIRCLTVNTLVYIRERELVQCADVPASLGRRSLMILCGS